MSSQNSTEVFCRSLWLHGKVFSLLIILLDLTQTHQTSRLWWGSCLKPCKGSPLPDTSVCAGTSLFTTLHAILAVHAQHPWHNNSTLWYETCREKTKFCPPILPLPVSCLWCLPAKGTPLLYMQAQSALQLTQILPAQTRDLETTCYEPGKVWRAPPRACISRREAASLSPLPTSPTPFPDQITPLASEGWPAPWLSAGSSKSPITLGALTCPCIPESCWCCGPTAWVFPCQQRPQVPRGRSAISSFACTSHMTPSRFQACCWQSIYFK